MNGKLIKGDYSYGNPELKGALSNVIAGKFCSISDFATFDCGAQHGSNYVTTFPLNQKLPGLEHIKAHPISRGHTLIGNDVWVADGAIIMSGVRIYDGAIIGAGAVVTRDVMAYEVVGGVPAKHIRFRFDPKTIKALIQLAWWDWPLEKIIANAETLMSSNVEEILKIS